MNVITKQISPLVCRIWKVILWHTFILNPYLQGESSWISTRMRCVPAKAVQFPKNAWVHSQKHTQGWYWYLTTFLFFPLTYLLNFGYAGSFLLWGLFLLLQQARATLWLQCAGVSLQSLLLLQGTGSILHGLSSCVSQALEHRLNSGTWALLLHSTWDLPRPGIESMSPALAGGFLSTELPGKLHH